MPAFNDLNLTNWKNLNVWTDSLWIINQRDKSGKHSGFYHGNFVPQIPRQLISRYTRGGDVVLDPFVGIGCKGRYQYDPAEYRKTTVKKISKMVAENAVDQVFKKLYPEEKE